MMHWLIKTQEFIIISFFFSQITQLKDLAREQKVT